VSDLGFRVARPARRPCTGQVWKFEVRRERGPIGEVPACDVEGALAWGVSSRTIAPIVGVGRRDD